jgi:hypothetical protein
VHGDERVVRVAATFDSSYPTGGEPLVAADLGLARITHIEDATAKNAAGTSAIPVVYDHTNSKLQGYEYNGASAGVARLQELANAFDASAFTARLTVYGLGF